MGKIVVDMSICKGCGYCVQFCPAHAIRIGDKRNTSGYGNHLQKCKGWDGQLWRKPSHISKIGRAHV